MAIPIAGESDFRIDSARKLYPITEDMLDSPLPEGTCRGIWLSETAPATISYLDDDDAAVNDLVILPGPNMIIVKEVKSEGTTAIDIRAIY